MGEWPLWLQDLSLALLAIIIGLVIKIVATRAGHLYGSKQAKFSVVRSLVTRLGRPLEFLLPIFLLNMFLPLMHFTGTVQIFIGKLVGISLIIAIAYLLISVVYTVQDYVAHAFDLSKADNLKERKIRTPPLVY